MLLSDLKSIGTLSGIGMEKFIPYLQSSYKYIINKISLLPSVNKMIINKACRIDQFNSIGIHYESKSEIAFKEIPIFLKTNRAISFTDNYIVNDLVIGKVESNNGVIPELYIEGSNIICTNLERCYVLALGYIYPYPVFNSNWYLIDEHRYDIKWMIDTYGFENLQIDNVLAILCGLRIKSLQAIDNGSLSEASNYDYLIAQMLNKYNSNKESIAYNTPTIDYGVSCH